MEKQKELKQKKTTTNKPVTFRLGLVKVNEWRNERELKSGEHVTFISYDISKSYKDDSGEWKDTRTVSREELRTLHRLITFILDKQDFSRVNIRGEEGQDSDIEEE